MESLAIIVFHDMPKANVLSFMRGVPIMFICSLRGACCSMSGPTLPMPDAEEGDRQQAATPLTCL
jgi:hypothetical protein